MRLVVALFVAWLLAMGVYYLLAPVLGVEGAMVALIICSTAFGSIAYLVAS